MTPELQAVLTQIETIRAMDCGEWLQHTTKGEDKRWKLAQALSHLYELSQKVTR